MSRVASWHPGSYQLSRVIVGALVGLAAASALESGSPQPVMVARALLIAAAFVGAAQFFWEIVGIGDGEGDDSTRMHELLVDVALAAFGAGVLAIFFLLSAAGLMHEGVAFDLVRWSGLALVGFCGYWAARLGGVRLAVAIGWAALLTLAAGPIDRFRGMLLAS